MKLPYDDPRNPSAKPTLGGLLSDDIGINEGVDAVKDWWNGMNTLQQSSFLPVVGDVTGLLGDAQEMYENPESRTWTNAGFAGLGLLPFVPAGLGTIKKTKGIYDMGGQSKEFTKDVFSKAPAQPDAKARELADSLIESGGFDNLPTSQVSTKDLTPTQNFIHESNLNRIEDIRPDTNAYILRSGGENYVLDGHHRIAGNIVDGSGDINAHILDLDAKNGDPIPKGLLGEVDTSYRGAHQAPVPEGANSLDNLADIYPDDVYSSDGLRYYGAGLDGEAESLDIMRKAAGNPDAEVTIYRAVPKGVEDINAGDWVALSEDYVKSHGGSWVDDGEYDVISRKVNAGSLNTDGDALTEWGYNPAKNGDPIPEGLLDTPPAPQDAALATAQKNATLPLEEGGLGLPANNTAQDRAAAMGYTDEVYHGTNSDIKAFDNDKAAQGIHWMAEQPEMASEYARTNEVGGNVIPLSMNLENPADWDAYDQLGLYEYKSRGHDGAWLPSSGGDTSGFVLEPNQLRSRFAAFDPKRRNSSDLLAGIGGLGLTGLLGAGLFPRTRDNEM